MVDRQQGPERDERDDETLIEDVTAMSGDVANQLEEQRDDAAQGGASGGAAPGGRGGRNRPAGMGEGTTSSASGDSLSAGTSQNTGTTRSH